MIASDKIDLLVGAFVKAQASFEPLLKDATASTGRYSFDYATLERTLRVVLPHLHAHGLCISQPASSSEGAITINTYLLHQSGQWLGSTISMQIPPKAKAQELGSLVTYLRRYSLQSLCGVAPGDDDGNQASGNTAIIITKPPPVEAPPPPTLPRPVPIEPEPPAERWTDQQRKRFCAALGDCGCTYDDFCEWSEGAGHGRPSSWPEPYRQRVLKNVAAFLVEKGIPHTGVSEDDIF